MMFLFLFAAFSSRNICSVGVVYEEEVGGFGRKGGFGITCQPRYFGV